MPARIELIPTLDRCIETTAKQEFARHRDEYLKKGEEDRELEERIELLSMFLESTDFKKLRSMSEKHLKEGKNVRFEIFKDEEDLTEGKNVRFVIFID